MKKVNIKTLLSDIEHVVNNGGKAGLQEKINEMAEQNVVPVCPVQTCPEGKIWSSISCTCVADIG